MTKKSPTRERILAAADRVFYQFGVGAVGVDRISDEANVGKMTLYRHFPSKDDLIQAYLERRHHYWQEQFVCAVDKNQGHPEDRIARLFERMAAWFESPDFFGCAFINADAERADSCIEALVQKHKSMMRELIRRQVNELNVANPESLTEQIFVLAEGAIVTARLTRSKAPADTACTAALTLIDVAKCSKCGH